MSAKTFPAPLLVVITTTNIIENKEKTQSQYYLLNFFISTIKKFTYLYSTIYLKKNTERDIASMQSQ